MKIIRTFISTLFIFSLMSCVSNQKFDGKADLVGCICSPNGRAVSGYGVVLDGERAVTNENGMFVFNDVKAGKILLSGGKPGWRHFEKDVNFFDKKTVQYIQVESMDEIYDRIDGHLRNNELEEAKKLLESEEKYNSKEKIYGFYHELIKLKSGKGKKKKVEEYL